MRDSPADVVFVPGYYTDVGLIARQKKSLGVSGALLGGDGWDSPRLVEIGGDALEGAYFGNHYSPDDPDPAVAKFVAAYRTRFGSVPDSIGALAYDAARLLADAIRRAGSTAGARVREALAATKGFPGVTGDLTFDLERNPVKPIAILVIRNGRYAFVKRLAPERR
jgi:branched-chain amino acid transport system substrate-binding protein